MQSTQHAICLSCCVSSYALTPFEDVNNLV